MVNLLQHISILAIREKTTELIQAKNDRLNASRLKRDDIKKKQLEAANYTEANMSPHFFPVQET